MKKIVMEFIRRGLAACGFGPIVLALVYLVLQRKGNLETVTVNQVFLGIFSLSALAFIAGGMNVVYQIERIPLMGAILIHGCVLYITIMASYAWRVEAESAEVTPLQVLPPMVPMLRIWGPPTMSTASPRTLMCS